MNEDNLPQKVRTSILQLDLAKNEAMLRTKEGQYIDSMVSQLHPEIKNTIHSISTIAPTSYNASDYFKQHTDVVAFLQAKGCPVNIDDIAELEQAYLRNDVSNTYVRRFFEGSHPKYNVGAYMAYFGDWQLHELKKIVKAIPE